MYKIGVTGSIGTGKTTITNMFALFNIPIFSADNEIKKILNRQMIKQKLKKIWPQSVKNNKIDKVKLRSIIFNNKNDRKKIEQLLYPFLEIEKNKFEKKHCIKKILVYDVPLIYETKTHKMYDLILLANCNEVLQKKRVLNRDNISDSLYEKIVASQLSFKEKKKFYPRIINTNNVRTFILIKVVLILFEVILKLKVKKWKKKEN